MNRIPVTKEVVVTSVLATVFPHKDLDAFLSREARQGMHPILARLATTSAEKFDTGFITELGTYLAPFMAPGHQTDVSTHYINAVMKVVREGLIMFHGANLPYEYRRAYEVLEDDLYEFLLEPFEVFSEEEKAVFMLAASYGRKSLQEVVEDNATPFERDQVSLNRHEMVKFVRELTKRLTRGNLADDAQGADDLVE